MFFPNSKVSSVPQNGTLFGNKVFINVISYDEVILECGGALNHYDQCLYKKDKFGYRHDPRANAL